MVLYNINSDEQHSNDHKEAKHPTKYLEKHRYRYRYRSLFFCFLLFSFFLFSFVFAIFIVEKKNNSCAFPRFKLKEKEEKKEKLFFGKKANTTYIWYSKTLPKKKVSLFLYLSLPRSLLSQYPYSFTPIQIYFPNIGKIYKKEDLNINTHTHTLSLTSLYSHTHTLTSFHTHTIFKNKLKHPTHISPFFHSFFLPL